MALGLLVTVSVAIVALLIALILEKKKFYIIPVSAFQIFLGAIVGGLWIYFYDQTHHGSGVHGFQLTGFPPELFSSVMLPIIIFEAGWNSMETRKILFHNLWSILAYAVIGTVISTVVVAGIVYFILHKLHIEVLSGLDILVLSTLISAVDPVATLSVFAQLEAHPLLNVIVFGESVLNDAVAIILFRSLVDFYGVATLDGATVAKMVGKLVVIAFGSTLIGVVIALLAALILKYAHMQEHPVMEMMFIMLTAFLAFLFTEVIHLSGVIAIFFYGIAARHYLFYNLSRVCRKHGDVMFGVLKEFAEMMVFVLLGMQLFFFDRKFYDPYLIIATIVGCLVGRAANIFPITFLLNLKRKADNKISPKMQLLMWWAGLRGAVAYVLAMSVPIPEGVNMEEEIDQNNNATLPVGGPSHPQNVHERVWAREEIITTTHTVIIFTILVLGGPTAPLLKCLGLSGEAAKVSKSDMEKIILRRTNKETWLMNFDRSTLIPFFSSIENRTKIKREQQLFRLAKLRRKNALVGILSDDDVEPAEHQEHLDARSGVPTDGQNSSKNNSGTVPSENSSQNAKNSVSDERHHELEEDDVKIPLTSTEKTASSKHPSKNVGISANVKLEQSSTESSSDDDD